MEGGRPAGGRAGLLDGLMREARVLDKVREGGTESTHARAHTHAHKHARTKARTHAHKHAHARAHTRLDALTRALRTHIWTHGITYARRHGEQAAADNKALYIGLSRDPSPLPSAKTLSALFRAGARLLHMPTRPRGLRSVTAHWATAQGPHTLELFCTIDGSRPKARV